MKRIKLYTLFSLLLAGSLTSCNYLDIVPDEAATEKDMSADLNSANRFLYSCYGFLPQANLSQNSLDYFTGDEVVTAFEQETFASFPKGNYSASNPVISYWNTLFQGIRQTYAFQEKLDDPKLFPGVTDAKRADFRAQTDFLIAYYHFLLARSYGPIILITSKPDATTTAENYLARTNYDKCVEFICDKFDEAAKGLPATRTGDRISEFGLATSIAAKAMKAKMLLYAASPLFNGNSKFYTNLKNKDGEDLMPLTYDANKWVKARDAYKDAIQAAESAGYTLYKENPSTANGYPADPVQRRLRYTITDYSKTIEGVGNNPEVIWADARDEGYYGMQNKSLPFGLPDLPAEWAWNGVAPTWTMLNRFYTKNGLPLDEDKSFDTSKEYDLVTVDEAHANEAKPGKRTLRFNLDREPRYYAWIAFQNGYYEVMSASNNGGYAKDPSYQEESDGSHGRLVCDFVLGGNCSRGSVSRPRTNNYAPTGFLNKKGVPPEIVKVKGGENHKNYPWPLIRLAELYLGYAEACVETGDLATARTYINKVRERAGIPTLEAAWANAKHPNNINTQEGLRDIVRQERLIEFYLENQNFWDIRRWLLGEKYFNVKAQGLNIDASSLQDFAQPKTVVFERKFTSPANYLMPIPSDDLNKDEKLVQNPGY